MILSVFPIQQSLDFGPLSYRWNQEEGVGDISPGLLVKIPYGKILQWAVVFEIYPEHPDHGEFELRDVESIGFHSGLSAYTLHLIPHLASDSCTPIHIITQAFLSSFLLSQSGGKFLDSFISKEEKKQIWTLHHTPLESIFYSTLQELTQDDSVVIIAPDDYIAKKCALFLNSLSPKIIHSSTSGKKRGQITHDLFLSPPKCLIGTRRLLFYPLHKYSRCIYLEDGLQQISYQQRRQFSNLRILQLYRIYFPGELHIISQVPTLTLSTYTLTHEFPIYLRSH